MVRAVTRAPLFNPDLFAFLRELKKNNDRTWFAENKARYEASVKGPLLAFITELAPKMKKISPKVDVDPKPVGGSMFRIHRDTRFARDKSPYKTHASAHFPVSTKADVHGPGFYLHLEPGSSFAACGIWRPETKDAARIRASILARGPEWKKATTSKPFRKRCELEGDVLKRPPKGVAPDHPLLEDLKRKDFIASAYFSEAEICAKGFLDDYLEVCRLQTPMMSFLARAVRVAF